MTKSPVLSAASWPTNGHLIADVARLGHLRADDLTLDPTYGGGVWWKRWRPDRLVRHDIDPDKAPDGPADFTRLPYRDGVFDVVAFDPPYVAPGGRDTTTIDNFNRRFGIHLSKLTPADNQRLIDAGTAEAFRVTRPYGRVLVKCMDYVSSGRLWLGTHHTLSHALAISDGRYRLRCIDQFVHVGGAGPQPKRNRDGTPRRQAHARNNASTLFVLQKVRTPRSAR